jgi:hypothetical protein
VNIDQRIGRVQRVERNTTKGITQSRTALVTTKKAKKLKVANNQPAGRTSLGDITRIMEREADDKEEWHRRNQSKERKKKQGREEGTKAR